MSIHHDRTFIAELLLPLFPEMEKATSQQWADFLNARTGLNVPATERNGSAFDRWRQALASKGHPVWPPRAFTDIPPRKPPAKKP